MQQPLMNKLLHFFRIPGRHFSRAYLCLLVLGAIGLALPRFQAQQPVPASGTPGKLHLYLLIGQSNMAGRAAIPDDAGDIIDRWLQLNWILIRQRLHI